MRIAVHGLWHLGSVTAACLAEAGHDVTGIDADESVLARLREGIAPVEEPGLNQLLHEGLAAGRLSFVHTDRAAAALTQIDLLWVTFDTPVDEDDRADVSHVRRELERLRPAVAAGTLILISSQVPAGFARRLLQDWKSPPVRIAVSPENLRLGKALDAFRRPERIIVGVRDDRDRAVLEPMLSAFTPRIEWMSPESAEMAKHALNSFLATSVAFINEIARLCETVGANAKEVERALKSEARIGPRAYLGPGAPFAGGTLARDLRYLEEIGASAGLATPLVAGALESNARHTHWLEDKIRAQTVGIASPVVALLGLVYTAGTNTLRRSGAVDLAQRLAAAGVRVKAHDPAIAETPAELKNTLTVCASAADALRDADVAVVSTAWPEYRSLRPEDFTSNMRRACVIDQNWFVADRLSEAAGVIYLAPGYSHGRKEGS